MTTLSEFVDRIRRAVDDVPDTGDDPFYSDEIINDAILASHKAILPWHPKLLEHIFTSGAENDDGEVETDEFVLPDDFYGMDAFREDKTGVLLPSVQFRAHEYVGENVTGNSFYLYPTGKVALTKEPETGDTFTMFYRAYWTEPEEDGDVLEVPEKLEDAMLFYCCAYLLTPESVSSASIRQWNRRTDSGNPEDNPVATRALHFMRLFKEAVTVHKAHVPGDF